MECTGVEYIETQNVKVAFLPIGDSEIELLEAVGEESPVHKFIEKRGEGLHHIAFRVEALEEEIAKKDIRLYMDR
jgi:methylmalonyl-CoA epimerase